MANKTMQHKERRERKYNTSRRPEIDDLLTGEYSLEQVARRVRPVKYYGRGSRRRVTRERIRQYIRATRQYRAFRTNRKTFMDAFTVRRSGLIEHEKLERQKFNETLVNTLGQYLEERLKEENFSTVMTVRYIQNTQMRSNSPPLSTITELAKLVESENTVTQRQAAKMLGIADCSVPRILKRLGQKPFNLERRQKPRVMTPKEKKDAIKRAYRRTKYSGVDIAYFLRIPDYVVRQNMRAYFGHSGERQRNVRGVGSLTYHMASEVYELNDLGFSQEDIIRSYGDKGSAAEYALDHRKRIERDIMSLLKVLYPKTTHRKPYVRKPL